MARLILPTSSDSELPKALNGMVESIRGLHNFRFKPHVRNRPHFTSNISGNTFVVPDDWATIYDVKPLYSAGLDGSPIANPSGNFCDNNTTPCSIVVVGQSNVQASDLANFRTAAGLPAKTITTLIPPGNSDPGLQFDSGDEGESDLDLEWANGIAKNANVLFITADTNAGNGVVDAWRLPSSRMWRLIFEHFLRSVPKPSSARLNRSEESLFRTGERSRNDECMATGDAGASADCDTGYPATLGLAVDYPSSSQYVTGVGGAAYRC